MSAVDSRIHLGPIPNHNVAHAITLRVEHVSFWYGEKQALKDVSIDLYCNEVTAFIGPSGCGKSTLLRCLNRTNDVIADARMEGRILRTAPISMRRMSTRRSCVSGSAGSRRSRTRFRGRSAPTSPTEPISEA